MSQTSPFSVQRSAFSVPVGEIIETSVAEFTSQACRFGEAPPFGSFVKAELAEWTVYGLVYAIHSGSLDPGGRAVMRGRDGVRDAQIYAENPDLEQVLRTEFTALTVGFAEDGTPPAVGGGNGTYATPGPRRSAFHPYLPPQPPPLHWSVRACSTDETVRLTDGLAYFRTVLDSPHVPADALLSASIRLARAARVDEPAFGVRAGRELATVLRKDYARLSAILRTLAP